MTLLSTHSLAKSSDDSPQPKEKTILGWVEYIELLPSGDLVKAKLDTGAKTSSLHATNIQHFEKDGQSWVRFDFNTNPKRKGKDKKKSGKTIQFEAPIERSALIKQHKRASVERTVILLPFKIAGEDYEAQFTLTDRSKFIYPVLLGRRFLKSVALVDPGKTFLKTTKKHRHTDSKEDKK